MSSQEILNRVRVLTKGHSGDAYLNSFIVNLFVFFDGQPPARIQSYLEDLLTLLE